MFVHEKQTITLYNLHFLSRKSRFHQNIYGHDGTTAESVILLPVITKLVCNYPCMISYAVKLMHEDKMLC